MSDGTPSFTTAELWRVERCKKGAEKFAPGFDVSVIEDEVLLATIAAAEEEYGRHDPADLASVIDWPVLRRRGETFNGYMERVGRIESDRRFQSAMPKRL